MWGGATPPQNDSRVEGRVERSLRVTVEEGVKVELQRERDTVPGQSDG